MDDSTKIEQWSQSLADITKAVNGGATLDQVLSLIAKRTTLLVDFACCSVFTRAPDDPTRIFISGSYNLTPKFVENYREQPMNLETAAGGRGAPSVRAVLTGKAAAIEDLDDEVGADADRWRASGATQGFRSILAVPIVADNDEVLGSLTGYSSVPRAFAEGELRSMALLAQHAQLAIVATRNRDRLDAEIRALEATQAITDEKYQRAAAAAKLHGRLMRLIVDGAAGNQEIIDAVAAEVGGPATVWDARGVPIVSSSRNLSPEEAEARPSHQATALQVCAGREPLQVASAEGVVTYWAPIELYDHAVGALAVAPNAALQDLYDEQALVQCALTIAFSMSKEAQQAEAAVRLSHELLGELLSPSSSSRRVSLSARAAVLGHDLAVPHVAAMFVPTQSSGLPHGGTESLVRRLASLVSGTSPRPIVGQVSGRALVLLPEHGGRDALREPERLGRNLQAAFPDAGIKVVVGPSTTTMATIRSSCQTLEHAASLLRPDSPLVIDLSELGVMGLLLETGSGAMLSRFADKVLAGLPAGDKGDKLLETLRVWLESGMSTQATSTTMHLHQNTVSYRLRRSEELLGLDLRQPQDLLSLQLAILVRGIPEGRHARGRVEGQR